MNPVVLIVGLIIIMTLSGIRRHYCAWNGYLGHTIVGNVSRLVREHYCWGNISSLKTLSWGILAVRRLFWGMLVVGSLGSGMLVLSRRLSRRNVSR